MRTYACMHVITGHTSVSIEIIIYSLLHFLHQSTVGLVDSNLFLNVCMQHAKFAYNMTKMQ